MACRSAGDSKESSGLVALKASSSASLLFLASLLHHHFAHLNNDGTFYVMCNFFDTSVLTLGGMDYTLVLTLFDSRS